MTLDKVRVAKKPQITTMSSEDKESLSGEDTLMSHIKTTVFVSLAVAGSVLLLGLVYQLSPDLNSYREHFQMPGTENSKLKVSYLGVTTLLFDDGETTFMTDGFFSRPGIMHVLFGSLNPDERVIDEALKRAGFRKLAAVIPIHSHYDHSLDSAMVAEKTGAKLIGSSSTANIGRGFHLPESQIQEVHANQKIQIGKFQITFLPAAHSPGGVFEGQITKPIALPARVKTFQMGDCYSLLIEHSDRKILVHGSAGFIPGQLRDVRADTVFLGIGTLGKQSDGYRQSYWDEVVKSIRAKKVTVIHWDNFFSPLSEDPKPLSWPLDHFEKSMDFMIDVGKKENVDIRIPVIWQKADL